MADFKKLEVFHKSHGLALNVIRISTGMRGPIAPTIRSQMVRAALSVPTNLVEGSAKRNDREFARFTKISLGSISELEYHLMLAADLGLISSSAFQGLFDQLVDVRKMLTGLLQTLQLSDNSALKARRR